MNQNSKTLFRTEFIDILMVTQDEADRLGYKAVYDIFMLKNLIYYSKSHIKDFFQYIGADWTKINNAIQQQSELYVKENNLLKCDKEESETKMEEEESEAETKSCEESKEENKKVVVSTFSDLIDWEVLENFSNLSTETKQTISNAAYYSYDGEYMGEIEYILAILEEGFNKYVEGFFRLINIDTRLVQRYYEGLMAETNTVFEPGDNYQYDNEEDENDYSEVPTYVFDNEPDLNTQSDNGGKHKVVIPFLLQGFLNYVDVDTSKESPICGREKETLATMQVLLKSKKCNAVLVGQPGVGKTAIVEHLTWLIKTGNCPEELKNKTVISLDVNALIAGAKYVGMAEERFDELSKFLKKQQDVILFIDEMHTIVGAGSYENNTMDLANALKPLLARGEVSVIGATTKDEYENWMSHDKALKRRFEKIEVREPDYSEVYPMVKLQVANLKKYHGVKISHKMLDYIIKVAGCFNFETANPDRTLDLVDKAMATTRMQGRKTVTMDIIMSNFDANFKIYNKMSKETKYQISYHELGHYIVRKYSEHIAVENILAISIIPAEDYLGVTVHDNANESIINWTYDAHLEEIATLLAGRVAEKIFSDKCFSGADNDLKRATKEAKRMVVEYGFSSKFSRRNVEEDRSEKQTEDLNREIDKIIDEGYELAEKIILEHKELLEELAKILAKKGILVGSEIETICRNVEKRIAVKGDN